MPNEIEEYSGSPPVEIGYKKKWITCSILLLINLLNYIDRYSIVGVLPRLSEYFTINDKDKGLLQTVFVVFYMFAAPLFGYLGDRYNRKMLMISGIVIWISAVFASSFVKEGESHFNTFLLCRAVVGIGEASYSTIAPTILSDIFSGSARSRILMLFYFAIPVGSGLGFIAGSKIALLTNSWQWGVRFSPIVGIACLALMVFLFEEPVRGACDGARQSGEEDSLREDLRYLLSIKTFYLVTLASTAAFFTIGAMTWWTPEFVGYAYGVIKGIPKTPEAEKSEISLWFGAITSIGGILGVATGSVVSRAWRDGTSLFRNHASEKADLYICALAMFIALPFLFLFVFVAEFSIIFCLIAVYFAIMSCCMCWAVNVDTLMYVVVAHRRASALAVQTMVAHLLGDAASPYIIGAISDWLRGEDASNAGRFAALQKAFYGSNFMLVIAGALYLAATFYVEEDRKEALFQMDVSAPDHWREPQDDMEALIPHSHPDTVEGREEEPADIVNEISHSSA
uniref:MFS domain-containing protein n=1 Tax=Caenorhabditis tropicalis TaxID=1561998 RepID=A0A1I7ULH1_9PELO